jgi:ATP-dependent RNA helicase DDX46/PRP5
VDESYFDDDDDHPRKPPANGRAPQANGNGAHEDELLADGASDPLEDYMTQVSSRLYLPDDGESTAPAQRTSRCICFENLISAEKAAASAGEAQVVRNEVGQECSRWGRLLRVHVPCGAPEAEGGGSEGGAPEAVGAGARVSGLGRVFVEFEDEAAAVECAKALDGRRFDGMRVTAFFYPVGNFYDGEFDEPGAPLQATSITLEDIVAMNSRPASSWDTMLDAGGTMVEGSRQSASNPYGQSDMEQSDTEDEKQGDGAGGEDAEEPANFHNEFMQRLRQQADDAARAREKASQQLMDTGDDAMDALVEEFPDMAEHADVESGSDSDDAAAVARADRARAQKKELPKVDHSQVTYPPFRKAFYIEVPEIQRMTDEEVAATRLAMDKLKVRGKRVPKPIKKWSQCGLSDAVLAVIEKSGYTAPFPIQAQAMPAIMQGRDVIAIAKTGSGKTMGYTLPMLRHVLDQPPLAVNDGPIALIMVPTRELAMQVYREVHKFSKLTNIRVAAVYGGAPIKQQIAALKRGAEVVVCTPGRMIDMLTANSGRVTDLRRVTYVVLDEADRMFDMGFAPQIDRIVGNTRPDRQTMLFSATFPAAVEKLARGVLTKPIQIVAGGISIVSNTIEQHVEVQTESAKLPRLCELLRQHFDDGQILVFVDTQEACDALFRELLKQQLPCSTLHGGMSQADRDSTIADFKAGNVSLLVATSVAARGLDVKDLVCVINYEVPNHYEDYVHRVGRTGRAGAHGIAYTFITPEEEKYAPDLVKAMEAAGQEPPDEVVCMANAYNSKRKAGVLLAKDYRTSGFKSGKGVAVEADAIAKEERKKKAARMRERAVAGVEGAELLSSDDEDAAESSTGGAGSSSGAGDDIVQAAAKAARALQIQLGNGKGAAAAGNEVQRRMLEMAKKAGASSAPAAPLNPHIALLPEETQRAIAAATKKAQEQVQLLTKQKTAAGLVVPFLDMPQRHVSELEINDYPQTARWKVTHRDSIQAIQEWTKAAIITKGAYFPPGRNPPAGERKLYLRIEAETADGLKAARKELRRILQEQSAMAAPDDSSTNRYAKYNV